MFSRRPPERTNLDKAIDSLLVTMSNEAYESDDYPKMLDHLTKLYALKEKQTPKRPSPDTVLIVVGNITGILLIIGYERVNVITSKALAFVMKLK